MRKLAGLFGAVLLAAAAGACSSSGNGASATATAARISGTETLVGMLTGAAAAEWLNSFGSAAPLFASLVFTGQVDTTISGPVSVASGNAMTAIHTFVTRAGNLTVRYAVKTSGGGQPIATRRSGSTCYFKLDGGTGSYTVLGSKSTGRFAGATGHGSYALMILTAAPILPDKTLCDLLSGDVSAKGTSVTFKASGPLALRQ